MFQKCLLGRQDPVSTMQKTGWTNYSSFLVWTRVSPMDVNKHFPVYWAISTWWRTTNRVILEQACSWPEWEGSLLQYHPKMSIQECCNLGFARLFIYLLFLCNMFLPYGHDHLLLREGPPKRALLFRKSPKYGGRGGVKVPNFGLENLLGAFPDSEA